MVWMVGGGLENGYLNNDTEKIGLSKFLGGSSTINVVLPKGIPTCGEVKNSPVWLVMASSHSSQLSICK